MVMTNAERQAKWQKKRNAEIESLRAEIEALHNAAPAAPAGPFADCTPGEVDYLRRMLEALRNENLATVMQEAAKMAKDSYAKGQPERDAKLAARAALKASLKPKDGEYWVIRDFSDDAKPVPVRLKTNEKGKTEATLPSGQRLSFTFNVKAERWEIGGDMIYPTRDGADYIIKSRGAKRGNPFTEPVRPLKDKSEAELRQIRSRNHPDKNHPGADPATYQAAVEELDRRRK